jgi:hypothetical protein
MIGDAAVDELGPPVDVLDKSAAQVIQDRDRVALIE